MSKQSYDVQRTHSNAELCFMLSESLTWIHFFETFFSFGESTPFHLHFPFKQGREYLYFVLPLSEFVSFPEMLSRQHWTTAIAVGVLVLYIIIDIVGKALDKNMLVEDDTSARAHSEPARIVVDLPAGSSASQQASVASLVKHQESQIHSLMDELRKTKILLSMSRNTQSNTLAGGSVGVDGSSSVSPAEAAESITKRFLFPDFPFQAALPGEQCVAGIGIPAADTAQSRSRRVNQRSTWHTYDGVRNGAVVVRYLLARHPNNQYEYSQDALLEAKEHHDVYALKMREGIPTQRKEGMKSGYWGFTAALGISRKGLIWYRMGAYYNCSYILKGDDDMYWNVPQYLHDIQQLPKTNMMWGKGMHYGCRKKSEHCVYFVVGMVLTMSRDVAMAITHVKEFVPWADAVENDDREDSLMAIRSDLQAWTFDHEDVLVGRLLRESGINVTVYDDFRFHDCGVGFLIKPVNKWSVVMHRCSQDEWPSYRRRFREDTVIDWKIVLQPWMWKQTHRVAIIDRGTFVGFEQRLRYQFLERVRPPGEPSWD